MILILDKKSSNYLFLIFSGYLLFYTTDVEYESNWAMEKVLGDRMTCSLNDLTPNTLYKYKMQARNNKGFGPFSPVANFTTLQGMYFNVILCRL